MSSPSSDPKQLALVADAARMVFARPISSVLTSLIVAAVCVTILATTGQTVQNERSVLRQIDDAGTRSIILTDERGSAGIPASAVTRINALANVEWAIGLGFATNVRNSAIDRLGMPSGIGAVTTDDGHQLPVVGTITSDSSLEVLNSGVLTPYSHEQDAPLRSIHVQVTSASSVGTTTDAILMVLGARDGSAVSVHTSETLAAVRAAVQGELGRFSRSLVLQVLAIGLVLVALSVFGSVNLQRQGFGRRRALGASRRTIVVLVTVQYLLVGLAGATIGGIAGVAYSAVQYDGDVAWQFVAAVIILAVLTTLVAALPPALLAAHRDPVRVLRVP